MIHLDEPTQAGLIQEIAASHGGSGDEGEREPKKQRTIGLACKLLGMENVAATPAA